MRIIFIIKPIGVITRKKTTAIAIGAITAPNIFPNLNHNKFNGINNFESSNPKIKKTKETTTDQILMGSAYIKGQIAIIKKTIKKTKPKLLFELTFILDPLCILFSIVSLIKKNTSFFHY